MGTYHAGPTRCRLFSSGSRRTFVRGAVPRAHSDYEDGEAFPASTSMAEQYDRTAAAHYSSYRPPLHQVILRKALFNKEPFDDGVDVGCGTGYSAVALADHCLRVYGVEPSQSMLDRAIPHARITYLKGTGAHIPLPDHSVDVVTFAGSLFYAKSADLVGELKRICRSQAVTVAYDFEILLDDVVRLCGVGAKETDMPYDYAINFSDDPTFREILVGREQVSLELTAAELAHVILSESRYHEAFMERYGLSDLFAVVKNDLEARGRSHTVRANIFYSKYETTTDA